MAQSRKATIGTERGEHFDLARGETAVELRNVCRSYGRGRNRVHALRDINEKFVAGSFTAVMGPSGSGKSTLLHCAAGLDRPSRGVVELGDIELSRLKEPRLTKVRRRHTGFIFQSFNLLPALTVRENIVLPMELDGRGVDRDRLEDLVRQVGILELLGRRPAELSGGQQQRVAIARALLSQPWVVFADEPTGALDLRTGREIMFLLRRSVDELGQTMVMVTHDPVAAAFADRVMLLADGRIVDTLVSPDAVTVANRLASLEE